MDQKTHTTSDFLWLKKELPRTANPFLFLVLVSRPFVVPASIALVAVAIAATLNAITPYIFKNLVNGAVALESGGSYETLVTWILVYIAAFLGAMLLWRVSGFAGLRWATGVRATSREAISQYVTHHSHSYFSDRFAGSISSKISTASNFTKNIVTTILWGLLGFVVTMVTTFFVALSAHVYFAIIFLTWLGFLILINTFLAKKRIPYSEAAEKAETRVVGETVDLLTNINAMHEHARRNSEMKQLREAILNRRVRGMQNWSFGEKILLLNSVLQGIFAALLLGTAIYLATKGLIDAGDVVLIITVTFIIVDRLLFVGNLLMDFGEMWGQVKEGLEDILIERTVTESGNARTLKVSYGEIQLDSVDFEYKNVEVFKDFSLLIPAGQRIGLVGRSGAGKSTLVKLLLRHYDLDSGEITIDGQNIAGTTKESLREAIAVVPQEPMLFHRSIRENIAYGKEDATEAEVIEAARLAEAHEFIEKLPEGYDAKVGERGVKLSGGQRQRVAIARAILKNAPILLLDEATSALDSESEVAVQKALLALMENRTVIAIAHRLSTLRAMDRLIVIDDGKIIESGTHEELLEQNGVYASLWNHQAGGFLEEE